MLRNKIDILPEIIILNDKCRITLTLTTYPHHNL